MRILVTGGKGFIGKHLCQELRDRGHYVLEYDVIDCSDISDRAHLFATCREFRPSLIIHLAGQVFLSPSWENPQKDATINIIGTINVLEAAKNIGGCGVIFSSSGAVYGSNDRSHVSEEHGPEPMSPYGASKLAAERYCLLYNNLCGVPTVVFRFSSVYGSGRKKTSINLILDKAIRGEKISITGDGTQTRDYTHVSDVVEALCMAVTGQFPAGIYNIGTGTSTSLNELIKIIEGILQKKLEIEYISKQLGDPLKNDFDVSKAKTFGFRSKIKLEDGIRLLIEEMS